MSVILIVLTEVSAATIVYDNTSTAITGDWTPGGFWPFSQYAANEPFGNPITLAGTDRTVVQFDLILSSSQQTTLSNLTLSFYEDDGFDAYMCSGAPGTQLWTTTVADVAVDGNTTVVFEVPSIEVPDTFIWIVSSDSLSAGPATYDPPTVGSSAGFFGIVITMTGCGI